MFSSWRVASVGIVLATSVYGTAAAEAPEAAKPLLRAWIAEQKSLCSTGKTIFKPGHVIERDVNNDGVKDFILDIGFLECTGEFVSYCGTGGCYKTIIASSGSGYVKAFDGLARDLKVKTIRGRPAIVLTLHGFACGKVGVQDCYEILFWNGKTFASSR